MSRKLFSYLAIQGGKWMVMLGMGAKYRLRTGLSLNPLRNARLELDLVL